MRIPVAITIGTALLGTALTAWSQVPDPTTVPAPPGTATSLPGSAFPPLSSPLGTPPTAAPAAPPGPAQTGAPAPPPAAVPAPAQPIKIRGRVGFGAGIYAVPGNLLSGSNGSSQSNLFLGGSAGIRWWMSERLALLPSLSLSVSHQTTPDTKNDFGELLKGTSTTTASLAPAVSLGYAAYRGNTTRFMLSGGASFNYSVQPDLTERYPDGSPKPPTEETKKLGFAVLAGMALEQFFTSRLSVVLGVTSPVFAFSSSQSGKDAAATNVSADFRSTQFDAAVFFYTD